MSEHNRAQAHTLEAIVAAVLLLSSLVFALQVTAVTPLSASTASQHIENQQRATAEGVLSIAANRGALKPAVLYWNQTGQKFHDSTDRDYYINEAPPNRFGDLLHNAFNGTGAAYNVYVTYLNRDNRGRIPMVYRGVPSDNAVKVSRTVTLYDDDPLYNDTDSDGVAEPIATNLTEANSGTTSPFYADDEAKSGVFNVVRVEVVVWRM